MRRRTHTSAMPNVIHTGIPVMLMRASLRLVGPMHQSQRTRAVLVAHGGCASIWSRIVGTEPSRSLRDLDPNEGVATATGTAMAPFRISARFGKGLVVARSHVPLSGC